MSCRSRKKSKSKFLVGLHRELMTEVAIPIDRILGAESFIGEGVAGEACVRVKLRGFLSEDDQTFEFATGEIWADFSLSDWLRDRGVL